MSDTSIQYSFTNAYLLTKKGKINCCISDIGENMRTAERKGKSAKIVTYRQQMATLVNVVHAIACFDATIDTNILSNLEILRLIENADGICGCC
jgi:hypothetical protein